MSEGKERSGGRSRLFARISVPSEVHLRRMKVHDALEKLDRYLSDAAMMGLPWIRVIHGKGTGIMRRAVVDHLSRHPLVGRTHPAMASEGAEGVTIAELK